MMGFLVIRINVVRAIVTLQKVMDSHEAQENENVETTTSRDKAGYF